MFYCGLLWYTVVYWGLLWVYCVLLCFTVFYCGLLWYTVVYCGLLWYTAVYCGLLWYTVVYCGLLWLVVFYQWLNSRQWAELHCETPNWQYFDPRKKKVLKHHQVSWHKTNPSLTGHQVFHFFIIRIKRSSELSIPSPHVTSCTDTPHIPTLPDSLQRLCREITHNYHEWSGMKV